MSECLVLNASWEPLTTIKVKRAVVLVLNGRADLVEDTGLPFRGATMSIGTPSVIRLRSFVKVPWKDHRRATRRGVLIRDQHICQFTHCNRRAETIDHVHPTSKGGKHEWTNLVAACSICNSKKADKTMQQLNWKLKRRPVEPRGKGGFLLEHKPRSEWLPYLSDWNVSV